MPNTISDVFKEYGYYVVPDAVEGSLLDFIGVYTNVLDGIDRTVGFSNSINSQDIQAPNALSLYADCVMETLLVTLKRKVEDTTGLSLSPTYSYYRNYKKGQDLEIHTDRPACEISATLCLGYSDKPWDILVKDRDGETYCVVLFTGDMLIYRGCEIEHWREPLKESDWNKQVFLHYVDNDGPYTDQKFDKRPCLGSPSRVKLDIWSE